MLNLKSLNQPLTPKGALKVLAAILLGAVLFFGARAFYTWLNSGPPSPAAVKKTIRNYLKKQTLHGNFRADFDLKLKETVSTMQTNAVKLRQSLATLQTNTANLRSDSQALRRDFAALQEQASTLKHHAQNQEEALTEKQRRLNVREQEFSLAQTNAARFETNLLAAKAAIDAAQAATSPTLKTLQADLATKEARFKSLQAAVAAAQTNLFLAQTNLAAAREALETKRAALDAKRKEVLAKGAALTNKQTEVAARQTELADKQKELAALQRGLANKEQLLTRQYAVYAQEVRKKVNEAGTYQSIYLLLGQQLWVADRLLESAEPAQKRNALQLAIEASQHAAQAAENPWLAARICEAYLWPNLELTDAKKIRLSSPEPLLQICGVAFQRAEENEHAIQNYQLTLKYMTNEFRADVVRCQLGSALEQANRFEEAMQCYRQVRQNTNYIKYAEQRLKIVKKKSRQLQAAK